jgi:Fur family ferric uptake transcriptional regulator
MDAPEILQNHHLKKTSPRVSIIQALQTSPNPLSEAEVKEQMGALYDRITFYRSVQTLEEAGIIHRIVADNTVVKYALNHCEKGHQHGSDHAHFYCTKCNTLVCLNTIKTHAYELPEGFAPSQCDVIIKGMCNICNNVKH